VTSGFLSSFSPDDPQRVVGKGPLQDHPADRHFERGDFPRVVTPTTKTPGGAKADHVTFHVSFSTVFDPRSLRTMTKPKLEWTKKGEASDFDAARNFLSLLYSDAKANALVESLRNATLVEHAAKDLLRAAQLPLLPRDEPHVDDDLKRIHKGKPLAPNDRVAVRLPRRRSGATSVRRRCRWRTRTRTAASSSPWMLTREP
jgi:hypothetical protein